MKRYQSLTYHNTLEISTKKIDVTKIKHNFETVKFVIPGQPQGKARPRVTRFGTYTPAKTHKYEDLVRYIATKSYDKTPVSTPVQVEIRAFFGVPKSYSKKRKKACLNNEELPTKKPDVDNIVKIILDGLNPKVKTNKITHKKEVVVPGFYEDDKQVWLILVDKRYSEEPRVEVKLTFPKGEQLRTRTN